MSVFLGAAKSVTRILSQTRKELIQIVRRPAAFISLVLGPFLLMALFGVGFTGVRAPLQTILVIPPEVSLPREVSFYQDLTGPAMAIRAVVEARDEAVGALSAGTVDLIVVAPADAITAFREGRHAQIEVAFDEIDPSLDAYARVIAYNLSQEVNKEILRRAVEEGEAYAVARLDAEDSLTEIPPEVIAEPTQATANNVAPTQPSIVQFFAPAVLALVLQHMAVTLSALSLVRERLSGTMEIFRVSPINSVELLLGKYLGFGIISAVMAVSVVLLMVYGLATPLLGSPLVLAGVIALVVFASLGLGLLISVVSDSERQAVQLSLLVLLASVFFSGIVLPVEDFRFEVRALAYGLPVTHGITLLQQVMLRGTITTEWQVAVLTGSGIVLLLLTACLLRRQLTRTVRA
ncbi:MAG: ABC transporter permease [Chloroflexota bacterium]|nr:ABC transporter permease [Chloroflexota bacterium]